MTDTSEDITASLNLILSLPASDQYSRMDAYRDMRKVFLGSDEGKRVLREILSWGRMFRAPILGKPIDPYAMAVAFGERNIALKLLATLYNEPKEQLIRSTTRKKRDVQTVQTD